MVDETGLSDHDRIVRIDVALNDPDTGLKAIILKNTSAIWGDQETAGLVVRVNNIEQIRLAEIEDKVKKKTESDNRIYAAAGIIALLVSSLVGLLSKWFIH